MELDRDLPREIIHAIGLHLAEQEHTDIRFLVGSDLFSSNQFIWNACSKFFRDFLGSGTGRLGRADILTVLVKGIDPQTFANVLHMISKGENKLDENNMIEMWYAAHHLKSSFLIDQCERFVNGHVTEDNYLRIYHHAAAFMSEPVLETIRGVMSRNFDYFMQTETFLNLTPKALIDVITSEGIRSHDSVIAAIFSWVNYERLGCHGESQGGESEPQKDGNERSLVLYREDMAYWDLEVTFKDTDFTSLDIHPTNRKELLGALITHVQFDLISKDGLRMLLDSNNVMENRDARNTVRMAICSQLESGKLVKLHPKDDTECGPSDLSLNMSLDNSLDSAQTVPAFLFLDKSQKLLAHNLLTDSIFHIQLNLHGKNEDIFTSNNKLYLLMNRSELNPTFLLWVYEVTPSLPSIMCYFGAQYKMKYTISGDFLYCFVSVNSTSLRIDRIKYFHCNQRSWTTCDEFHDIGIVMALVDFQNEIVGFFSIEEEHIEMINICSFNTTKRTLSRIASLPGNARDLVVFVFEERLFFIESCGNLTELVRRETSVQVEIHQRLWNIPLKIFGAVVLGKTLFVMANLHGVNVKDMPRTCQFGRIKFVHLINGTKRCHYLSVSKDWLQTEI